MGNSGGQDLTTDDLQRWGIVIPWYSLCRTYGESIDHLFLPCWVAREFWGFLSLLGVESVMPQRVGELLLCWNGLTVKDMLLV